MAACCSSCLVACLRVGGVWFDSILDVGGDCMLVVYGMTVDYMSFWWCMVYGMTVDYMLVVLAMPPTWHLASNAVTGM